MRHRRFAVEEFGAQLDRQGETGHAARPDAAADAVAAFEHQHRAPGARQDVGGR